MASEYYLETTSDVLEAALSRVALSETGRHPDWVKRRATESVADLLDPVNPPPGPEYRHLRRAVLIEASRVAEETGGFFQITPVT